jgi:hypothetical protein
VDSLIREVTGNPATEGDTVRIHRISFSYFQNSGATCFLRINNNHDSGDEEEDLDQIFQQWTYVERVFNPPLESTDPLGHIMKFTCFGDTNLIRVDNIVIDFDATVAS